MRGTMKKLSLFKLIVALVILNCYVFTCTVMGTVGDAEMTKADIPGEGETVSDADAAGGQGTLDFLVPDETGNGFVELNLLNLAPLSLSNKAVQSTYSARSEIPEEPEEDTDEVLGAEEYTDDATLEPGTDEIVINVPEETEEAPAHTTASTTTERVTTPAPATTPEPAETPAPETAPEPVTTPAPATTPAPSTTPGGIPVDGETSSPAASTTGSDDQPDEIEPTDEPGGNNSAASGEILYVRSNGGVVSGTALDIVSKITQNEVGHTFAPEAIKAQAVAAYTYVKFCNDYGTYPSVGLASTVSDSVRVLVESVIGKAVYYNGTMIQAVYSASSAGYTASSKNVWGTDYPYLVSRFCDLDARYDPNYGRKVQYTSDEIKSKVLAKTGIELSGDPSGWIAVEEKIDGNYVGQMSVGGYHSYTDSSGSTVKITGRVFREKIMSYDLRSSAFDVDYDSGTDTFTFTTYGYGHGVGMSQNGANALATYLGYDYKQILTYYYTGTEVK